MAKEKNHENKGTSFLKLAAASAPLGIAAYKVGQSIANEPVRLTPKEAAVVTAIRKAS